MKYTKELVSKIFELKQSGEYTDKEIQRIVGVSKSIWHEWKQSKKDFSEMLKEAEQQFISENLKHSARKGLKVLVEGTQYDETTTEYKVIRGKRKLFAEKTVTKKILPNPTAVIFTLKNVDSENFSDKHEVNVNGKISVLDVLSETDLKELNERKK